MRIFIAPFIAKPTLSSSYFITKNICDLFVMNGHSVAVCAQKENRFHHVSLYPMKELKRPFSFKKLPQKYYEEWLYTQGMLYGKTLEEDYRVLSSAINKFKPDLIISYDRPVANIIALKKHIPIWTIVNSDMYKSYTIDKKCMYGLNMLLSNKGLEQVYYIKDLYAKSDLRIGFGPIEIQPFSQNNQVTRIGVTSIYPLKITRTNRVCIFLPAVDLPAHILKKLILDAFLGAPYAIYAWFSGSHQETIENVHFLQNAKAELLPGCLACIHDGNAFYTNQCLARSIQQLIITNHDYMRFSNANSATHNHFGLTIDETKLTIANLYEQYRLLVTDDTYYYHAKQMQKTTLQEGDLTKLLQLL